MRYGYSIQEHPVSRDTTYVDPKNGIIFLEKPVYSYLEWNCIICLQSFARLLAAKRELKRRRRLKRKNEKRLEHEHVWKRNRASRSRLVNLKFTFEKLLADSPSTIRFRRPTVNFSLRKYRKVKHRLNENTKSRSKKNISFHYDLGNEFYKLWLNQSMTYSSGIFTNSIKDLHIAQKNKYKQIANNLNLNENSNVLEIGCGWGGFSSYIAKEYGSTVNAITISKEQFEFTSKKIFNEGLNEKVNVEMRDYRDIDKKYTNIASIEMFEAVGKKYWKVFFNILKESLSEEGSAALQIITIKDEKAEFYQNNPDFIQQYIFPGGVLPSKKQLKDINFQLGLNINEIQNFSNSYVKTLNIWNNKFQNSWPQIASQGFKDKFKKMWEFYFSYCEVGFTEGTTDVSHFIITK